jgi:hypothetical protein
MQQDNACFYELSSKRELSDLINSYKKQVEHMMASKSSGCGCGDSKMKGGLLQVCQCKQPKDL